jgi:uroporphyrin-3 C-methyltransferase
MMPDNETTLPPSRPVKSAASSFRSTIALVLAAGAFGLSGWQWQQARQQQTNAEQRADAALAASQQEAGARAALREQIDALQSRLGAIEGRVADFRNEADALQGLRQEIARGREEATLLEVEQEITLAIQQLQLAGNVQVAKLALQTADARLAHLGPHYLPLRKALGRDLDRLNALPLVDLPGFSLRLEQVVAVVDGLPLSAHSRPASTATKTDAATETSGWWARTATAVWQELKGLIRIQRFDQVDVALIAPGQDFLLRENLKLRLLNARLALLSRDQATFRSELKQAREWLGRYFVADDKAVLGALEALGKMAASEIAGDMPTLNETQAALRGLRNGKEKR